ncbi:MAG: metallophosphoesterase [Candidatus Margulisbacteria bacterium]|nr:metallophosphoesterase [Candidatus Margulisiibacteriota bacterium]
MTLVNSNAGRVTRNGYIVRVTLFALLVNLLIIPAYAFSFAVLGDSCDGKQVFNDIVDKINRDKELSFVVNLGDFVSTGQPAQYNEFKKTVSRLKIPVYNALGNHDGIYGGWKIFRKMFGPSYYSFDFDNSHFIVLDNAFKESFDRDQFEWLKLDLTLSRAEHKFVFMHKPVFDPSAIYKDYIMSGRAVTEELMGLFQKYKVDYVFAGHIHGYAKSKRDGVTYIISGGAGSPLRLPPEFGGFYHYVKIEVDGSKVNDQIIRPYE